MDETEEDKARAAAEEPTAVSGSPDIDDEETAGDASAATSSGVTREGLKGTPPEKSKLFRKDDYSERLRAMRIIGAGGLSRKLLKGGEGAALAMAELHRRQHHLPAAGLKKLVTIGCYPKELLPLADEVVSQCPICKVWEDLPDKAVASTELSTAFNEVVWADLVFWSAAVANYTDVIIMKLLDDATDFTMNPLVESKAFRHLRIGILLWHGVWGFPGLFKMDQESGMLSEAMTVWLEEHRSKVDPIPPTKKHTGTGKIDNKIRIFRRLLRRIDTSYVREGVEVSPLEIVLLASWCENSAPGKGGVTPSMSAAGHRPRDHLEEGEPWTTSQTDSEFLKHARLRCVAVSIHSQEVIRDRVDTIGRAHARRSDANEYALEDAVDVYREPPQKDLVGWRGPAQVVNVSRARQRRIHVEWGGRTILVPTSHLRHHVIMSFFAGRAASNMEWLMQYLEAHFVWGDSRVYGVVPHQGKFVVSKAAKSHPRLADGLRQAARELALDAEGAVVGAGLRWLPPVSRDVESLGVLLLWRYGQASSLRYREVRGHWATDLTQMIHSDSQYQDHLAVCFYSFDLANHTMSDGRLSMTECPWASNAGAARMRLRRRREDDISPDWGLSKKQRGEPTPSPPPQPHRDPPGSTATTASWPSSGSGSSMSTGPGE
jgi:hypothetical protein